MNKSRSAPAAGGVIAHRKPLKQRLIENWQLYLLLLIPVILTIVYKYADVRHSNCVPRFQSQPRDFRQ